MRSQHVRVTTQLRETRDQAEERAARVNQLQREREQLQQQMSQLETQLDTIAHERDQLLDHQQQAQTHAERMMHQYQELQQRCDDLTTKLTAAESDLKQHHQLAAMIHKLSGQATVPVQ